MAGLQRFGIRIRTTPYLINTTSPLLTWRRHGAGNHPRYGCPATCSANALRTGLGSQTASPDTCFVLTVTGRSTASAARCSAVLWDFWWAQALPSDDEKRRMCRTTEQRFPERNRAFQPISSGIIFSRPNLFSKPFMSNRLSS